MNKEDIKMETEMLVVFLLGLYITYKLLFEQDNPKSAKRLIWR